MANEITMSMAVAEANFRVDQLGRLGMMERRGGTY